MALSPRGRMVQGVDDPGTIPSGRPFLIALQDLGSSQVTTAIGDSLGRQYTSGRLQDGTGTNLAAVGEWTASGIPSVVPNNLLVTALSYLLNATTPIWSGARTASSVADNAVGGTMGCTVPFVQNQNGNFNRWRDNSSGPTTTGRAAVCLGTAGMTSLAAAAAVVNGNSFNLGGTCRDYTFNVTTTGAPATISVQPQGSLDGVNWYNLGAAITVAGQSNVTGIPSVFVRMNLTALTGGTAPTVSGVFAGY